jgi:tRNA (guanine37-N1)-methyltransferase
MRIDIVTVLPELLRVHLASIMKRAIDKGLVEVHFHNLRRLQQTKKVLTITLMVVVLEW